MIDRLLDELDEHTIAEHVGIRHDDARIQFPLVKNRVDSYEEFQDLLSDYFIYHYTQCVAPGASLTKSEAASQAKEILEEEMRRRRSSSALLYQNACDGRERGVAGVIDILSEALKNRAIEWHIRSVFDRYIRPHNFEDKVAAIRGYFAKYGSMLHGAVEVDRPERYAASYEDLIRAHVDAIQQIGKTARSY